ncbi:succinate--CoA ligase subunit alpha [Dehalococcoidia bacterium]|nr:succinate--CoA ligase subunit alpha [Dehalococcoidia bacterium]MCL0072927.1 succinate--CoA ligase subunit alpha [Dehalococcoidia bacterium]MCL0099199.1 succinate--CoA ligase subunit alpha [Dehalococcoidia bacterium]
MSILLNRESKVLVQGITGRIGRVQTRWMLDYGTNIVAGVTPGKGGEEVEGIPVYDTVAEAVIKQGAEASVFFVPAGAVKNAALETIEAGVRLVVIITEHTPVHDVMEISARARERGVRFVGPTSPGIITPGEAKMGIMPGNMFAPGRIGVISRSGTLAYEISANLASTGLGQSTVVGMGADPVVFSRLPELLELFEGDPDTDLVVIIGEVGGIQEEKAAEFIARQMTKPVVAYIAGCNAPEEKRMGHAGAIIQGGMGTAQSKITAFREIGVPVAEYPLEVVELVQKYL